jgi:hypothetical protein
MTDATGPDESLIVQRYRALLRLLPPSYRAAREEEMVAAFAEGVGDTEEERLGRPDLAETASVMALATRTWLGGSGATPRLFCFGQTVRHFGAISVLSQAVLGGAGTLSLLSTVLFGSDYAHGLLRAAYGGSDGMSFAWTVAWHLLDLLSVPAYVAVVRGQHRTARILVLAAAIPPLLRLATQPWVAWSPSVALLITVLLPALAVAVAFHRDAPTDHPVGGLAALPVGVVAVFAALPLSTILFLDPYGVYCWIALAAGAVLLVRGRPAADQDVGHRSLAIAVYAVLVFAVRMLTVVGHGGTVPYAAPVAYGQAAAVLLVACLLLCVAVRTLRRAGPAPHRPRG